VTLVLERPLSALPEAVLSHHEMHGDATLVVRRERLLEALLNARRLTRAQASALQTASPVGHARNRLCVRQQGNLELIPVDEIRYFQADQKYVTVRTAGASVLIEDTLKSLEEEFSSGFIRIHRNALVAVEYLCGLEKSASGHFCVRLQGIDECLEVSRRHIAAVRKRVRLLQG